MPARLADGLGFESNRDVHSSSFAPGSGDSQAELVPPHPALKPNLGGKHLMT